MFEEDLLSIVLSTWELPESAMAIRVPEAMNSWVWFVDSDEGRRVVKAVPDVAQFSGGLRVAERLERPGFATGAPVRTPDGRLWIEFQGHAVALLRYVHQRGLASSIQGDRVIWGRSLAVLHRRLAGLPVPGFADSWPWKVPDPSSPFLAMEPWLRPTIEDAVVAASSCWNAGNSTLLHGDPSASDFRVEADGKLAAVIDWGYAMAGPPLSDLACAVFFEWLEGRDGGDVVDAYDAETPVDRALLAVLLRRRVALQAWWLAWRESGGRGLGVTDSDWTRRSLATVKQLAEGNGWLRE